MTNNMKTLSKKFALCCAIALTSLSACSEKKPQKQAMAAQTREITLNYRPWPPKQGKSP
jgi:hypothetical protein